MKTCFFIGHHNAPSAVAPLLDEAIERHITEYGVDRFIVGRYGAFDASGEALYASMFDLIDVKSEDTLEGEVSYDLTDAVTLSAKVSAKVAYSLKVSYDVRLFGKDYYEIEYKAELSGKIGGSVKAKAEFDSSEDEVEIRKIMTPKKDMTLHLDKYYIPTPIPALNITVDVLIPLKLDVQGEVSWEGQFKITSGFTYHQDAKGKYQDSFEDKSITTDTFKVSVEGSVSFGIHAAVGADFASVISAEVGAEAGIKVKIGAAKKFGSGLAFGKPEEKHYCAICLEGEAKLYFKADISFHLGFKIEEKIDIGIGNTWKIAEVEFLKRNFYYSVDLKLSGNPNYKGFGAKCPNRGYLVTVLATDGDGKEIADLDVRIFGSDKNGATDDKLKTGGSVYLRPGTYTAYVTGSDGKEYTKAFTVSSKAQEVVVEVVGQTAISSGRRSAVTIDLCTGRPQILYYNASGRVDSCIKFGREGYSAYDHVEDIFGADLIQFDYGVNGNLTNSFSTALWWKSIDDSAFHYDPYFYSGKLKYQYVDSLIKAYTEADELVFVMDEKGNIVNFSSGVNDTDYNFSYTYGNDGKVLSFTESYSVHKYYPFGPNSPYGSDIIAKDMAAGYIITHTPKDTAGTNYEDLTELSKDVVNRYGVSYNVDGNIIALNYASDSRSPINTSNVAITYDGNGEMSQCESAGYETYKFTYDETGEVVAVSVKWGIDESEYHYTGNDGDHDTANAVYYRDNVVKASAHYFVDDDSITQSVGDLTVAWAVGGKKWSDCARTGGGKLYGIVTNANSISIEMCDTVRDGTYSVSEATAKNAIELGKLLMERYHIPLENVVRHFDVTGKYCPRYLMDEAKWAAFKARLTETEAKPVDAIDKLIEQMTPEQAWRLAEKANQYAAKLKPSEWAAESCRRGIKSGLFTDGDKDGLVDNAQAFVKRQELATVLDRAGVYK